MQVAVGYRQRNDGFGLLPNNDLRDFESHAGTVPVGLADHALAKSHEVLVGERSVDSVLHACPSLNDEKGGGHPSPCDGYDLSQSFLGEV